METYRYDSLAFQEIHYTQPEKRGTFYYSEITYGSSNSPLMVVCPPLRTKSTGEELLAKQSPYLVLESDVVNTGELATSGSDDLFHGVLAGLDQHHIDETHRQSEEWFGKKIPSEMIDDMYKRINKPLKSGQKPLFSFKVPMERGVPKCKIYTQAKAEYEMKDLPQDTKVAVVLHIRGLKFLKQHYYCDCYISQVQVMIPDDPQVRTPDVIPQECLFSDEETVDESERCLHESIFREVANAETKEHERQTAIDSLVLQLRRTEEAIDTHTLEANHIRETIEGICSGR